MAPLPPQLRRPLTLRFQQSLRGIGARTTPQLARAWSALDSYHEDDIATFTASTAPALNAAKFAAVRQAAGYYALTSGVRAQGVKATAIAVEPDTRAPFIATWLALKNGDPIEVAIEHGASRLAALADNLVTSSARMTAPEVFEKAGLKIAGYTRTPDADACNWCIDVSDLFFKTAEEADIGHDFCGCSLDEVFA